MKKLLAVMCAVLVLGSLSSEAQARRGDRRNRGDNQGRDRRDRGDARRPDRRPPHDPDYGRDNGRINPHRNINRYPAPDRRDPRDRRGDWERDRRDRRDTRRDGGYRRHMHRPHRDIQNYRRRYHRAYDYDRTIPYRFVYDNRWIRFSVSLGDGFFVIDDYPYYIYHGYRHRYSYYDTCDYDLVDSYTNSVSQTFYGYSCASGYDYCADMRDNFNYDYRGDRYFCSERVDPQWHY